MRKEKRKIVKVHHFELWYQQLFKTCSTSHSFSLSIITESGKNNAYWPSIKSLRVTVSLTILNTKCNLFVDRSNFNLYNIRPTYFLTLYNSKFQYTSLANRYIVWISTEPKYILSSGLKIVVGI